ncbi:MAG: YccF domain-containing protein [Roseburia sp.]|nr:YccF domain-containing protein [Roseburia sp.]
MRLIGNILWLLFTGLWTAIGWFVTGLLWCITIIGIPFGLQAFKLAKLSLWPFGRDAQKNFGKHPIANVIWIIFGGLFLAIGFGLAGILWCITIIGIPFGKQCFKLAGLALTPFGAEIATIS